MSHQIVLNSSNYSTSDKEFKYQFATHQTFHKGDQIAVQSLSLFNSFFNISSAIGNNVIKIDFPTGQSEWISSGLVTIDDGFYDASGFNSKLQQICYDNKFYTDGSNGKILYYFSMGTSTTQYANILTTYSIGLDAVPVAGATWGQLSGTQRSPRVYFGKLGTLYGFPSDSTLTTHYGYTTDVSLATYSPIVPQVNPFNSVVLRSNIVNNGGMAFPTDFLYSVGLNNGFGDLVTSESHEPLYNQIATGTYSDFAIKLYDNTLKPLELLDTNVLIVLSIIKK